MVHVQIDNHRRATDTYVRQRIQNSGGARGKISLSHSSHLLSLPSTPKNPTHHGVPSTVLYARFRRRWIPHFPSWWEEKIKRKVFCNSIIKKDSNYNLPR